MNRQIERDNNLSNVGEQSQGSSESVCSTKDTPTKDVLQVSDKVISGSKIEIRSVFAQKRFRKSGFNVFCSLFVMVFAAFLCLLWIDDQEEGYNLVPT